MEEPHIWKHGWADAYASGNVGIADDFLSLVVRPSLRALERREQELLANPDAVIAAFAVHEHGMLRDKAITAFCLSIQSLFEQQIRSYLTTCAHSLKIPDVSIERLEKQSWGPKFDALFLKVRGLPLTSFDSYERLTFLHQLGNACRHGDGSSCRQLYDLHPELWPDYLVLPSSQRPPFSSIIITEALLASFIDAIVLFWMDMQRYGLESFWDGEREAVGETIERLRLDRISRL